MVKVKIAKKLTTFELNVDFSINNDILVVVGPSGAGKTTILQCIAGLQTPTTGEIIINNKGIFSSEQKINLPVRKRRIGYVFQDYALFPHMTIEKNVSYGIPKKPKHDTNSANAHKTLSISEVLGLLKIDHLRKRYPHQISGGEKQRVALARALMTEPELMLLDEPLSALDPETRQILQQELLKVQRKWQIPFILVTHDSKEAELLGDQIMKINNGSQEILAKSRPLTIVGS